MSAEQNFESTTFDCLARIGDSVVNVSGVNPSATSVEYIDFVLDCDEARSLAVALLAAADASEVQQ